MKKIKVTKTMLLNYLLAVLMLLMIILQFTPFWHYNGESSSISRYIWLDTSNTQLSSWLGSQIGKQVKVDDILAVPVLLLVVGAVGTVFCVVQASNPFMAIFPAVCGALGILGYLINPVFRLGSNWILHFVLFIVMLLVAAFAIVFDYRASKIVKGLSQGDIQARVNAIKNMDISSAKKKRDELERNFHRLLGYLRDENTECKMAALEKLSTTSSDVAITHITYLMEREDDENVKSAMKKTLGSIRDNIRNIQSSSGF